MVPRYQPGRGYDILPRYLDNTWFINIPEGIILSTGYIITIDNFPINNNNDEQQQQQYLFIQWSLRYLFESEIKDYDHKSLDIWNIEIEDITEMTTGASDDDGDDDSTKPSLKSSNYQQSRHLKTLHQTQTSQSKTLVILFEFLVSDYEEGIQLKTSLDIIFQSAIHAKQLQPIFRFSYKQELRYRSLQNNFIFYQLIANKIILSKAQVFYGYDLDLIPLSKRPIGTINEFYHNISWNDLQKDSNNEGDGNSNNNSHQSDQWYMHLFILTSKLDVGDIMILVFLPFGILFGVFSVFKTYQSIHDRIINEMGYEIKYDYIGDDDQEQLSSSSTTTPPTTSNSTSPKKGEKKVELNVSHGEDVIELTSYMKSSVY